MDSCTKSATSAQRFNCALIIVLCVAISSFMSMSVFTVPIELASPALNAVWSSCLGLVNAVGVPVTLITTIIINAADVQPTPSNPNPRSACLHKLTIPITAPYMLVALAVPAIQHSSPWLLRIAGLSQAVPFCGIYFITIHLLLSWLPTRPALGMSLVSLCFGLSQFLMSPLFSIAVSAFGVCGTLATVSVVLFALTTVLLLAIRYPTNEEQQYLRMCDSQSSSLSVGETTSMLESQSGSQQGQQNQSPPSNDCSDELAHKSVPWNVLVRTPAFYHFMAVVFLGRTCYAMYPFFFKVGYLLAAPNSVVVFTFQALSLFAIIWAFSANAAVEYLSKRYKGVVQMCLAALFIAQGLLLAMLAVGSSRGSIVTALLAEAIMLAMLETQTAFGVLLGREMFGSRNQGVVWGLAGGASFGMGEAFFTVFMGMFEGDVESTGAAARSMFVPFYMIAVGCCVVGSLLSISSRRSNVAFG